MHRPGGKTRGSRFHDNTGKFRPAIVPGAGFGQDGDTAGDIGGGIGDKNLAAVYDPLITIQNCGGSAVGGIRACVGFSQTKSPEGLTAAQLRQVFFLLLFVAEIIQGSDAQRIFGGHGGGVGTIDPGDFFNRYNIGLVIHCLPAVLLGHKNTEQTEFRHLFHGFIGKLFFFIQFRCNRFDLIFSKTAHRIP